jgi:hypothetical protein
VKLLEIQSSPRGDSSDSIALTTSFIEACKSDNASIVVEVHHRTGGPMGRRSWNSPREVGPQHAGHGHVNSCRAESAPGPQAQGLGLSDAALALLPGAIPSLVALGTYATLIHGGHTFHVAVSVMAISGKPFPRSLVRRPGDLSTRDGQAKSWVGSRIASAN